MMTQMTEEEMTVTDRGSVDVADKEDVRDGTHGESMELTDYVTRNTTANEVVKQ